MTDTNWNLNPFVDVAFPPTYGIDLRGGANGKPPR